jgi:hypothetical protein
MKTVRQNFLLIIISSLIALISAEILIRIVLPWFGYAPRKVPAGLLTPHPARHFTYTPDMLPF